MPFIQLQQYPHYSVSEEGIILGWKNQPLKCIPDTNGYLGIFICEPGHLLKRVNIHRLIAQTFIPNPDNKPCINHKDGNKSNNHVSNLEWVTYSENQTHSRHNNLNKGNTHLTNTQIKNIRQSNLTAQEVHQQFNISYSYAYAILRNAVRPDL